MQNNWYSCDGAGFENANSDSVPSGATQQNRALNGDTIAPKPTAVTRRGFLMGGALAALGFAAGSRGALGNGALSDVAFHPRPQEKSSRHVLVTIFLRGGADGLNVVVPYGEDAYGRNRQTIGVAAPRDRRQTRRALDLDGFFGLHPSLSPLLPFYREGSLGFVHACGSGDRTHSHFEAMGTMERGAAQGRTSSGSSANGGWIARHLAATATSSTRSGASPLSAVAFSNVMPESLRGATNATALNSLDDLHLFVPATQGAQANAYQSKMHRSLQELYSGKDEIARAGRETLAVLSSLRALDVAHRKPANGALYPDSALGNGLRQVAALVNANVGLETACLDKGGWDTHVAQGADEGWMASLLDDLGRSLAAFARDMGRDMNHVTVVVMSEFGRRLQENSGLGTDHGRAGAMMLLGGGVRGGQVFARWPGLENHQLEPPGDLRVTTDYRDVLGEILVKRMGNTSIDSVFPNYTPQFHGLVT